MRPITTNIRIEKQLIQLNNLAEIEEEQINEEARCLQEEEDLLDYEEYLAMCREEEDLLDYEEYLAMCWEADYTDFYGY